MANYREIVTKAVISKGKKKFTTTNNVVVENPTTILGCWILNHKFNGNKCDNKVIINGSYDINIWYSYDNGTKTDVIRETNKYKETINIRDREECDGEEIIVRSLKQPSCVTADILDNKIVYTVEKELGVELIGDIKVKIESLEEDPWDEICDSKDDIDNINDNFIK